MGSKKGRKRAGARREHTNKGSDNLNPLSSAEVDSLIQEITEFTRGICREVVGKNLKVESKHEAGKLIVNILSDEIAALFSKNTKLPEAFEHLLRKKPRQLMRELPFRIFVDAQGVRQKRENKLINMAKDLSNKVSESSKPIVLNYSNPYDRKVIHMALDQDTRVHTKSIGSGPSRRLMILPNRAPSV